MNWKQISDWYYRNGFFDACEASKDRRSDLRRFGDTDTITQAILRIENCGK